MNGEKRKVWRNEKYGEMKIPKTKKIEIFFSLSVIRTKPQLLLNSGEEFHKKLIEI